MLHAARSSRAGASHLGVWRWGAASTEAGKVGQSVGWLTKS